jgi:phosphoenolpyruvate carboxykinase (ATP)
MGVTEPQATFSACFGAAFIVWHPSKYAEMLAEKMREHAADAWLINTGLTGGAYGVGQRMSLKYTRALIDAIHSGALRSAPMVEDPVFGFHVPTECPGVPSELLIPRNTWANPAAYDQTAQKLALLFTKNFEQFKAGCSPEIVAAGPKVLEAV